MSPWNESQRRAILSGMLDVHHRLEEMETLLAQSLVASPFTQYVDDLSLTERNVFHDDLEQLRSTMLALLDGLGIPLQVCRDTPYRSRLLSAADFPVIVRRAVGTPSFRAASQTGRRRLCKVARRSVRVPFVSRERNGRALHLHEGCDKGDFHFVVRTAEKTADGIAGPFEDAEFALVQPRHERREHLSRREGRREATQTDRQHQNEPDRRENRVIVRTPKCLISFLIFNGEPR